MKEIKESRFTSKKPEDIAFKGEPITDPPTSSVRADKRSDGRSTRQPTSAHDATADTPMVYVITTPHKRRKTRHPFDIFEDQVTALKKIQMAASELPDTTPKTLGELAQQALDLLIEHYATTMPNVTLSDDDNPS